MAKIAPSILASNVLKLEQQLKELEKETDILHIDICDGHYVPNLSFGFSVVENIRETTKMFLDVHLMTYTPEKFARGLADAGADSISFAVENVREPIALVNEIKNYGKNAGIAINNKISAEYALSMLESVDAVTVMGIEAGFGGQKLIARNLEKLKLLKNKKDELGLKVQLEWDGGANEENGRSIIELGADVLIMGKAIFSGKGSALENIRQLKEIFGIV